MNWWIVGIIAAAYFGFKAGAVHTQAKLMQMFSLFAAQQQQNQDVPCVACNEVDGHAVGCPLAVEVDS